MRQRLKRWIFGALGKDPEAVVAHFWSGPREAAERMTAEVKALVPDRRHIVVSLGPGGDVAIECGDAGHVYRQVRRALRAYRIGLAPVLLGDTPHPLRSAASRLAPLKLLAFNGRLERHHLHWRTPVASWLFMRGVPLDRIFLRPKWLVPWKRDRSVRPEGYRVIEGRPESPERRKVAVLSPYSPYPLSHGGAVRIYNLLREAAREFDISLFCFADRESDADFRVMAEFCARVVVVGKPRYREPRWSTLLPPEAHEFSSPAMKRALAEFRPRYNLLQVEYTQLARYGGDVLVEHDVTFDLFEQVLRRDRTFGAWWDYFRWRRFETGVVRAFRRVVVMSEKDHAMLGKPAHVRVIGNGVDLERFQPSPEPAGQRLLFIGSFRHFPNIEAFRFFVEEVWPRLSGRFPEMRVTVVAGPDPEVYWREFTQETAMPADPRIEMRGFVADVRPLYAACNLVLVPTTVSAGTNVKVLEAMASLRAVVSTPSGCAGLGLEHGRSVWIAEDAEAFADGVARLIDDPAARAQLAAEARAAAVAQFDWKALGKKQRALWRELYRSDQGGATPLMRA